VKEINWKNYKIPQDEGSLPMAPMIIVISLVSTKVPYIVAGKFAVAYHEEIREQLKLALQTLGRMVYAFISHRQRQEHEMHRQSIFQIYAKEVARDLSLLSGKSEQLLFEKLLESAKHRKPSRKPSKEAQKEEDRLEKVKQTAPKPADLPPVQPQPAITPAPKAEAAQQKPCRPRRRSGR